jgi:hypothetical protein
MNSNKHQFQAIAWIAIPRTGTNFLCALLKHHPAIIAYYEIFHSEKFYAGIHNQPELIIKNFNQKYNFSFVSYEDSALLDWIHNNPQDVLTTLIELNPQKLIIFKLFPDQLNLELLKKNIIDNDRIAKILVKRNLLDSYISHEIAQISGFWHNYDTSNICLTLSIEKFIDWAKWAKTWYDLFENKISQDTITNATIDYETIHQKKTNTDKLAYLDRIFHDIGIHFSIPYSLPNLENINLENINSFPKRQDRRYNLADKITNYNEFIEELKKTDWYDLAIKN